MQLPSPPLQGTNQRSVHVKTDGSQIRLFQGLLLRLTHYPLPALPQPFRSTSVISLLLLADFKPVSHSCCTPLAVNHIILSASHDPVCTLGLVAPCLKWRSPHKLTLTSLYQLSFSILKSAP